MSELFRNTDPTGLMDPDTYDPDRPLSSDIEKKGQAAFEVEQRIKMNIGQMRTLWITIAEDLYKFSKGEMWRHLGLNSFDEWLAGPDVDLGRATVFHLIQAWRELVVKRGVRPHQFRDVPVSKLQDVIPAIRRGFVDPADAIADCRTLGRHDLRERYLALTTPEGARRDGAGAIKPDESVAAELSSGSVAPQFAAEEEAEWAICHACGSRYRVKR